MRISDWSSDVCSSEPLQLAGTVALRIGHEESVAVDREVEQAVRRRQRSLAVDEHLVDRPRAAVARRRSLRAVAHQHLEEAGIGALEARRRLVGDVLRDRLKGEALAAQGRSEEHTSELQSLMRISYAVFCLKKKKNNKQID